MNKFLKKRLFRGLVVLLPVLFLSVPKAHADIPIIGPLFGAIGGVIGDAVAGIVEGIANLLKVVISLLGGVFYFVSNAAVQFAMEMNFILPDSQIVKDGFSIVLTVANTALVAGILVIAFAVMTRADWLSEARTAIPKFIAAALLINFSLFIGLNLIIVPVNSLTKNIYNATGFDNNSFRGPFDVKLNMGPILQTQLAISKADDPKSIEDYFQLKEQLQSDIYDLLLATENDHFRDSLNASALGWNVQLSGLNIVTKSQREGVAGTIASALYPSMESSFDNDFALDVVVGITLSWDILQQRTTKALSVESGVPYLVSSVYKAGYGPEDLKNSVMNLIRNTYLNSSFSCDLTNFSGSGCESLKDALRDSLRALSPVERIIIAFVEVLFKGIFIFLGSFSLLGLASMLFIRYIALSLLLILFPFTWIGWIFPKIAAAGGGKNIWNAWWNQFIRWNIFGPFVAFFFFLAVRGSLILDKITPTTAGLYGGTSSIAVLAASVGNLMTVLGLLIGGMYVANKMGIAGSKLFYGSIIKMRNWAGKQVKSVAKKTGMGGLHTAGRYATAPARTPWGEKKLSQLQNLAADKGRFLKTIAKPITTPARLLMKAADKTAVAMVKRAQGKFADEKGNWKMAPYKAMQMYKTLTSDAEKMAFLTVATKNNNLWELPDDAKKDVARFMGDRGLDQSMWKRMGQVKLYLDLTEEGMSPEYLNALAHPDKFTAFDRIQILRDAYGGLDDAALSKANKYWFSPPKQDKNPDGTLRYDVSGQPVYKSGYHGLTAEEQEIAVRDRNAFLSEDRPNTAHVIGRKAGTEAQFNINRDMDEFRTGEHGLRARVFGHLSADEQEEKKLWDPGKDGDRARQEVIDKDWEIIRKNYETHALEYAKDRGAEGEKLTAEQKRIAAFLNRIGKAGIMKLVKDIESAKWGGFQAMMGPTGTYTPPSES